MKVAVWDTYVKRENGTVIYGYGREYLRSKSIVGYELTSNECSFCHVEQATDAMIQSINDKGYHILEIRNCD